MMGLPTPSPNSDSQPYWEVAREGRLVLQHCGACGSVQSVPRAMCGQCQSSNLIWRDSTGRGRITSFTEVHRGPTKAFREATPYVLALVKLEEGVQLMLNILGEDRFDARIGDLVEVVFEARGEDGMKMPQAKRKDAA